MHKGACVDHVTCFLSSQRNEKSQEFVVLKALGKTRGPQSGEHIMRCALVFVVRLRRGVSGVWSDQNLLLEQPEEREESRVRGFEGSGKNARPRRVGNTISLEAWACRDRAHVIASRLSLEFSKRCIVKFYIFTYACRDREHVIMLFDKESGCLRF